jgi:hypothetical protein
LHKLDGAVRHVPLLFGTRRLVCFELVARCAAEHCVHSFTALAPDRDESPTRARQLGPAGLPARDAELGITARDGATVVTVKGPRISTRAESRWFQEAGWEVINVAAYPEGWLAVRQGFAEPVPL